MALFKNENQVDDMFLDPMYNTEEPDPIEDKNIMDPYSKFGTLDPDGYELEDYDPKQLQLQNLN